MHVQLAGDAEGDLAVGSRANPKAVTSHSTPNLCDDSSSLFEASHQLHVGGFRVKNPIDGRLGEKSRDARHCSSPDLLIHPPATLAPDTTRMNMNLVARISSLGISRRAFTTSPLSRRLRPLRFIAVSAPPPVAGRSQARVPVERVIERPGAVVPDPDDRAVHSRQNSGTRPRPTDNPAGRPEADWICQHGHQHHCSPEHDARFLLLRVHRRILAT